MSENFRSVIDRLEVKYYVDMKAEIRRVRG